MCALWITWVMQRLRSFNSTSIEICFVFVFVWLLMTKGGRYVKLHGLLSLCALEPSVMLLKALKKCYIFHLNYDKSKNKQKHLGIFELYYYLWYSIVLKWIQFNIPRFWFCEGALPRYSCTLLHAVLYTANLWVHAEFYYFLREWNGLRKKEHIQDGKMNACRMLGLRNTLQIWWCLRCTCVLHLRDKPCCAIVFRV